MSEEFNPEVASGEAAMGGVRLLTLNELSLNADGNIKEIEPGRYEKKGGYFRKRVIIGNPKDQKPEEVKLGETITVVLLKVRRKLVHRGADGKIIRQTNEHNSLNETVTLYETETKQKRTGVAKDLREQFPQLRTVQIVYALLLEGGTPELVRFVVKGASLGGETKVEGVTDFYAYISSFRGSGEHFYQYKTLLSPVKVEAQQTYYVINFRKGEKLNDKGYAIALEYMKQVHENCTEVDTQRAMRVVEKARVEEEPQEQGRTEEDYPDDASAEDEEPSSGPNPDDIPF